MACILLIEPDYALSELYRVHLESEGYEVLQRKTAESAVMALDEQSVQLVILELQLAVHNGVEFLYEIRSYPEWQGLPVLLHTNVRKNALPQDALQRLGITKYMYKPTSNLQDLSKAIKKILSAS